MSYRISIGVSSFAVEDETPKTILEEAGLIIVPNPFQRRLTEKEIIAHLKGSIGLIAGLEPLNRKVLKSAQHLKAIARVGIGMDNIDLDAARELGIKVSNTPDGPTEAVAEMCLAALLTILRRLPYFNTDMSKGVWKKRIGTSLKGTKVLLIGYGRIGRRFGDLLRFLGGEILVTDPVLTEEMLECGERLVSLEEGIREAEIISLHANCIGVILGSKEFELIRPGAVLLNSARGQLIDEEALIRALQKGTVASAWIDTFWREPYSGSLRDFEQVLLTPHVSTYTRQCRRNMEMSAVQNLLKDLNLKQPIKS